MGSLSEAMAMANGTARMNAKGIVEGVRLSNVGSAAPGAVQFALDTRAFSTALGHVFRESNRSAQETVKYGMILMLTAGRARTKIARKKRRIEHESGHGDFFRVFYQQPLGQKLKWLPWVHKTSGVSTQQQQRNFLIRQDMIKRYSEIQNVGLAKASWGWALKKYCGKGATTLPSSIRHDPISGTTSPLSLQIENRLSWIRKLPGCQDIETDMVKSATGRLNKWLELRWQSGIDRAARRAS